MLASVTLKPGVLFVRTASGGTLMDLGADRFVALSPVSATIWNGFAAGLGVREVVVAIMQLKSLADADAQGLLRHQLERWEALDLVNVHRAAPELPRVKTESAVTLRSLPVDVVNREPFSLRAAAQLFLAERKYQRALRDIGLAKSLLSLQCESGTAVNAPDLVIARTVRAYNGARRAFRQGRSAQDCLLRSLALAAVLRRQGVEAEVCFGIIDIPFSSHAWVEAAGFMVNEPLSSRRQYTVIGRF